MNSSGPTDGTFEANGLTIHYLDWGNPEKMPLILLHHVSSQAHAWDMFAQRMRNDYCVIAMDLRGHGDSGWAVAGKYTTEDYASDVAAMVRHLGIEKAIVAGGSLGGRVAMVYAAQHPEVAVALIMEDVGAVRPESISQNFANTAQTGDPEFDTVEEWATRMQGNNTRTPRIYAEHAALHATKRLPNGKLGLKRDLAIQSDFVPLQLWHYVEKLTMPFLLMIGSESAIVGEDQQTRFREIRPDMEMVTVQGAGHHIVHDKAEEFESIIRTFLRQNAL